MKRFSELQDFDLAILSLKHSGALVIADNFTHISDIAESKASPNAAIVQVKKSFNKHTTFYSQMFEPFLLAYWVSAQETVSMLNCQTRLLSIDCNFTHLKYNVSTMSVTVLLSPFKNLALG